MNATNRLKHLLLAGACVSLAPIALAQDDPAPIAATSVETAQADESEEITVTATRRATKIQATPIAITAISEKAIENASIRETQTLTQVVPSLAFPQSESSGSVTARIRGVGTQGSNPGLESAVGIFIDGVYRSRNSVGFGDLGDLQRVEVLRGPQGTLFGRNTSAGLISVITREPSLDTVSGNATTTYESFGGIYLTAGVTAPLTEGISGIRLFGSYRKVDGYMDILSGPDLDKRSGNDKESWSLRGQYLYKPNEKTSIRIIADASSRNDECCYAAVHRPGGPGALGRTVFDVVETILGYPGTAEESTVHRQVGFANRKHPQLIDDYGISAEVTHDMGWAELTSITAYRDWRLEGGSDADYTAADFLWTDPDVGFQHFKTFTQEFRVAGSTDWVDWLVGAFYSNENLSRETSTLNGVDTEAFLSLYNLPFNSATGLRNLLGAIPGRRPAYTGGNTHALGTGLHDYYEQDAESIAFFTHNVVTVTDQLKLTLGLRYTSETKEVDATYRTNGPAGCAYLESIYGYNPNGTFDLNGDGIIDTAAQGGTPTAASAYCVPWGRSALDVLTADAPLHQKETEKEFSGIATLAYAFTDDLNAYATYSRGYKAGGFNLDRYFSVDNGTASGSSIVRCPDGSDGSPAQRDAAGNIVAPARPYTCARPSIVVTPDISFAPEFVDAFEIGLKTTLMDGDLQLNFAAFYQDFENYQLNTFTGVSFVVTPVPEVIAKGFEIDVRFFPDFADGLVIDAGLTYADTRYGKDLGSLTEPGSFLFKNPNLHFLPGEQLTSAPKWTVTGGLTYEFEAFKGWTGLANINARHVSSQRTGSNLDPAKTQDSYTLVNLRLGLSTEDDVFGVEFWVKNLLDERYFQITFDAPLQGSAPTGLAPNPANFSQIGAFLAEPITLGVTLKTRF
jgi:outer membrane receptor protein involved in Fe transport